MIICHLKSALALLDASQNEFAEELGVSRNTLTSLSRNNSLPNLGLAYDIVDGLNKRAAEKGIDKSWNVEDIWEKVKSDVHYTS